MIGFYFIVAFACLCNYVITSYVCWLGVNKGNSLMRETFPKTTRKFRIRCMWLNTFIWFFLFAGLNWSATNLIVSALR